MRVLQTARRVHVWRAGPRRVNSNLSGARLPARAPATIVVSAEAVSGNLQVLHNGQSVPIVVIAGIPHQSKPRPCVGGRARRERHILIIDRSLDAGKLERCSLQPRTASSRGSWGQHASSPPVLPSGRGRARGLYCQLHLFRAAVQLRITVSAGRVG